MQAEDGGIHETNIVLILLDFLKKNQVLQQYLF